MDAQTESQSVRQLIFSEAGTISLRVDGGVMLCHVLRHSLRQFHLQCPEINQCVVASYENRLIFAWCRLCSLQCIRESHHSWAEWAKEYMFTAEIYIFVFDYNEGMGSVT